MRRMVLPVLALVAMVVAVVALPASIHRGASGSESSGPDPTSITRYNATFDLDAYGDLTVSETLVVDVPTNDRHGIFRFWDTVDENEPHARRVPRDVRVTRDGRPEPWEHSTERAGRFHVARIGSADRYLSPGLHTYVIDYVIEDALLEEEEGSAFYWDLVPGGWAQEIEAATLTVRLPAEAGDVRCAVGAGATSGCQVQGEGSRILQVSAGPLPPDTPVTVRATMDLDRGATSSFAPWSASLTPVLGSSGLLLALVLIGIGWSAFTGFRVARLTFESEPPFPLVYAPPQGVGPAQAAYVLTESIDRRAYVANLMYAAERGAVELTTDGGAWRVAEKDPRAWAEVDASSRAGVAALDVGGGHVFEADRRSASSGEKLKESIAATGQATRDWARGEHLVIRAGLGSLGGAAVIAAFVGYVVAFALLFEHMTLVALVPGAFAAAGLPMLYPGSSTMRTLRGRELWSRIGGFRRVLATPSSQARFEFAGREDLYTAYLPWAVAFGCADQWAAKYRTETGQEPPVPHYFGAYGGSHTVAHVDQMVSDFSATVDSAISAYQSSQSSSSSGGGGFSGGGGGGGGGGGSW